MPISSDAGRAVLPQPRPQGFSLKKSFFEGKSPGDEVGTPYDGLYTTYREAPPKRGIFLRLQVYERVGISLIEE